MFWPDRATTGPPQGEPRPGGRAGDRRQAEGRRPVLMTS